MIHVNIDALSVERDVTWIPANNVNIILSAREKHWGTTEYLKLHYVERACRKCPSKQGILRVKATKKMPSDVQNLPCSGTGWLICCLAVTMAFVPTLHKNVPVLLPVPLPNLSTQSVSAVTLLVPQHFLAQTEDNHTNSLRIFWKLCPDFHFCI